MPSLIGNKPNQVPSNGDLGTLAFQDATSVVAGKVVTTSDATINTLTVGLGGGAIATNTAIGVSALAANTTNFQSVAVGYEAGKATTTSSGVGVTFVGYQAGLKNTTGYNDAFGWGALASVVTGVANAAFGYGSLNKNTSNNNTGFGFATLNVTTTGGQNSAFGSAALIANTTGGNCSAFGYRALYSTITSANNSSFGYQAGYAVTGAQNTLLGSNAGYSGTNDLTTGSNNTIIGYNAASSSATVSNEVTIGNDSIVNTRLKGQVGVGLTPSTWAGVSYNAVEINTAGNAIFSGLNDVWYTQNAYYNSGWKYGAAYPAATYNQNAGVHIWRTAGTGTVGGALTWSERMRIHVSGGVSINNTTDPGAGNLSVTGTVRTQGYTVATLPAAGTAGRRAYVTDATTPTYLGALTGGGAVVCPVFDNGTAWVSA